MLKWINPIAHSSSFAVLDSSFNPPHNGHLEIVKDSNVVLLFSIKNMDKETRNIKDRVEMIKLLNLPAAITDQGRFVDKASLFPDGTTFIMGYDTLIRFFDVKYYTNFQSDMDRFFTKSVIKVFDRGNHKLDMWDRYELQHVLQYQNFIQKADSISDISSTKCREAIRDFYNKEKNRQELDLLMPPKIVDYILQHQLYKEHA
jgi:nicotinic acid mononucleotide adenylyltransferase